MKAKKKQTKKTKKLKGYTISTGGYEAEVEAVDLRSAFRKFLKATHPTGVGLLTQISMKSEEVSYASTERLLEAIGIKLEKKPND